MAEEGNSEDPVTQCRVVDIKLEFLFLAADAL